MADQTEQIKEQVSDATSNGEGGLLSSLLSKEIILPALATAGGVVAYTARKNVAKKAEDEAEDMGGAAAEGAQQKLGASGIAGAASKLLGGGGGGSAKKTRRLPIQRYTDVAAPVETVYEHWTEFEEFPNFMHRVLNVEQEEGKISWDEKIWFSKRHWEGEITERRKNEKIAWKTTRGMAHAGVVTFHRLEKNLTRVNVDMDFVPQGMIEKMASGMRFVKRAVEADLARFKAYVELGETKELEFHAKPEEREGDETGNDGGSDESSGGQSRERERAGASA